MSLNNNEEAVNPNPQLAIPEWVTESYFEDIVAEDVPDSKRIIKFTPHAATGPGENFGSIMVRALLEIEMKDGCLKSKSYILKTSFERSKSRDANTFFQREHQIYEEYLPKFENLYKETGRDIKFSPKPLRTEQTPERATLVLEDLQERKFRNGDRFKGLDIQHITRILQKLAELHAASARYNELNGSYDELYQQTYFNESNRKMYEELAAIREPMFLKAMRTWHLNNNNEYFIKKMPSPENIFNQGIRMSQVDPDEFNVLNHGDCWTNNVMFNYKENGEIEDVLFVDYQACKWGTPAHDLWYAIITTAASEITIQHFDSMICIYHKHLVKCLQLLKYSKPIPNLKDLHITMLKYGYWGVLIANGPLIAVLLPYDADTDIVENIKAGPTEQFHYKTFTNPLYVRAVSQLYPFFDKKGILDI